MVVYAKRQKEREAFYKSLNLKFAGADLYDMSFDLVSRDEEIVNRIKEFLMQIPGTKYYESASSNYNYYIYRNKRDNFRVELSVPKSERTRVLGSIYDAILSDS